MSSEQKKSDVQLSEPDQEVATYLQVLLGEVEEYQEPVETAPAGLSSEETPIEVHTPEIVSSEQTVLSVEAPQVQAEPKPVIPDWAQEPFQCLLFEVDGLRFGVPLAELNSIAEWQGELTSLPGQPDWHQGIFGHRGYKVGGGNTAKLLMPEQGAGDDSTGAPNHVLIFGGDEWGLMCDKLLSPVMLDPNEIHWSLRHESRPWMAGTLPDQLCILLDLDVVHSMIVPDSKS